MNWKGPTQVIHENKEKYENRVVPTFFRVSRLLSLSYHLNIYHKNVNYSLGSRSPTPPQTHWWNSHWSSPPSPGEPKLFKISFRLSQVLPLSPEFLAVSSSIKATKEIRWWVQKPEAHFPSTENSVDPTTPKSCDSFKWLPSWNKAWVRMKEKNLARVSSVTSSHTSLVAPITNTLSHSWYLI